MTLTLRAVSLDDQPLSRPITAHFDRAGGSIGRSDHSTLALPDPERHVSRHHADVAAEAGGYVIRNVGSANPLFVDGRALNRGESAPLVPGGRVRIGGYLLEVLGGGDDGEASTIVRGRASVGATTPGTAQRTRGPPESGSAPRAAAQTLPGGSDLGAPLSSDNPFAGLLGDAPSPAPPARIPAEPFTAAVPGAAGVPASSSAWAPPAAAPPPRLPDDFDPFAAPAPPAPAAAPAPGAGTFDDLLPGLAPLSLDEAFGLKDGTGDALAGFMAVPPPRPAAAGAGAGAASPDDPLGAFDVVPASRAGVGAPVADHVPVVQEAYAPPRLAPARSEAPVPLPPAPPPAASGDEARALWAAFCEGAGIVCDASRPADPETLRTAGSMLRAAVAGTLRLMTARAATRHELHAQVTMIQARGNNPLKFSPDAESALEQMLRPPLRGFLAGPAAMNDAMHDLLGHAIGTMAGTRAALEGVLDRFVPQQLEARLAGRSVLDAVLPMSRKARLWELYLQHYDAIRGEAQDDFQALFGRAFLAAYEQQLDRLRHEAPPAPGAPPAGSG